MLICYNILLTTHKIYFCINAKKYTSRKKRKMVQIMQNHQIINQSTPTHRVLLTRMTTLYIESLHDENDVL